MRHTPTLLALLGLAACADDNPPADPTTLEASAFASFEEACAAVPGCGEARAPLSGAETVLRVQVVRAPDGALRVEALDELEVAADLGVPVAPARGDALLVLRDADGAPLDGQLVAFPRVAHFESFMGELTRVDVSLEDREIDRVAWLRDLPGAVDVALLDASGEVVATRALPTTRGLAERRGALTASRHACTHVQLLDGELDRALARNVAYENGSPSEGIPPIVLVRPGPAQRAVVEAALGEMPPLLCHGLARIAFARIEGAAAQYTRGANMAAGGGDMILINTAFFDDTEGAPTPWPLSEAGLVHPRSQAILRRTITHEAGHAVQALLEAEGFEPGDVAGLWIPEARALAASTVANARLGVGFGRAWTALHDSFVGAGLAEPWLSDEARRGMDAEAVVRLGAMSRYGSLAIGDDVCEYIAWTTTAHHHAAAGMPEARYEKEDFACQAMRAYTGGDLPAYLSPAYTKLFTLHDLGLIATEDLERCVGTGVTRPGPDAPAMEFWQGGELQRTYDGDVEGGLYVAESDLPDTFLFRAVATGTVEFDDATHDATASLVLTIADGITTDLEDVTYPRGIFPLDAISPYRFELEVPEEPTASFTVTDGFALVVRGSDAAVEGSVFIREVERRLVLGFPQTFDPPLIVRFRIEP